MICAISLAVNTARIFALNRINLTGISEEVIDLGKGLARPVEQNY